MEKYPIESGKEIHVSKKKWDLLIALRGWEHPITRVAKLTGFTKSYVSQVINAGLPVSPEFMIALIRISGNSLDDPAEWGSLFEFIDTPAEPKGSFQKLNQKKYDGKIPYVKDSMIGKIRLKDKALDLVRLNTANPVPTQIFYDSSEFVPQKAYLNNRYGHK